MEALLVGVGDGIDAFGFEETLRLRFCLELGAVRLIGTQIVGGEHDGLAGKAVTKAVAGYPTAIRSGYRAA